MPQSLAEMPMAEAFERALGSELDGARASEIMQETAERYDDLYAERKRYDNRALAKHLEESILPGIALYQILLDDPDTQQASMDLVEAALTEGAEVDILLADAVHDQDGDAAQLPRGGMGDRVAGGERQRDRVQYQQMLLPGGAARVRGTGADRPVLPGGRPDLRWPIAPCQVGPEKDTGAG